jgi:beta-N-acetylhexosaminidase
MSTARKPISRRGALLAGSAAVAAGVGLAGQAQAFAPERWTEIGHPRVTLTPAQRAAQSVIYSYPGTTPPSQLLDYISQGLVAGVIFFGDNISSTSQIKSVIQDLNDAANDAPIEAPLLLMTDQEGGQVRRLPGEPTLSAKQVGTSSDPEQEAHLTGTNAGLNLSGVGMNVNLAPVLGVYRSAGDFLDQYGRSYSSTASTVADLGGRFVTAQQAVGVAATAKHFPGLGAASASQNTDAEKVTLTQSLTTLRNTDELPYQTAIKNGVKLVMLSWAVYTALDSKLPAGLSPTVIGELRNRLGFKGVTITDALEAGALSDFGGTAERAVAASSAGMDLLLCSGRDVSQGHDAVSALTDALADGTLDGTAFDAGAGRVTALRTSLASGLA